MEKINVFQNEHSVMVYYPDEKIVYNTFSGKPTGQSFRDALNAGVEVMKKYGATKWLSDDRKNLATFSKEDDDWANSDWFPRMVEIGWKTWAMVVPGEMMARMNITDIIQKISLTGVRVAVFSDPDIAMQWLINAE